MNFFHRSQPLTCRLVIASRRSDGIAEAPAMTLKRMYHWAPSAISRTEPKSSGMCRATNTAVANGNRKFAGNPARTCTIGWANLVTFGLIPIHTPTGTQITVATAVRKMTRAKVAAPSAKA
jgi:hypothetical protein